MRDLDINDEAFISKWKAVSSKSERGSATQTDSSDGLYQDFGRGSGGCGGGRAGCGGGPIFHAVVRAEACALRQLHKLHKPTVVVLRPTERSRDERDDVPVQSL